MALLALWLNGCSGTIGRDKEADSAAFVSDTSVPGPCTKHSQCKAPKSFCNPANKQCEEPTCKNGGVKCVPPKSVCNAQGKCEEPPPAPGGCATDADCCPEDKDKNQKCKAGVVEYCHIPQGKTRGTCKPGCNSNKVCKLVGLDSCNGEGRCIKDGEHGDPCKDAKKDCRAGYYCCPVLHRCFERCTSDKKCPDTGNKCIKVFINYLCVG